MPATQRIRHWRGLKAAQHAAVRAECPVGHVEAQELQELVAAVRVDGVVKLWERRGPEEGEEAGVGQGECGGSVQGEVVRYREDELWGERFEDRWGIG
jgi:hypothetical protein